MPTPFKTASGIVVGDLHVVRVMDQDVIVHAVTLDTDLDAVTRCGIWFETSLREHRWHVTNELPVTCLTCIAEGF